MGKRIKAALKAEEINNVLWDETLSTANDPDGIDGFDYTGIYLSPDIVIKSGNIKIF